ncbi:dTDP-4-dehydrorhamnose reductase [Pseudopedobacter saltans DSM 12145]|uniref:dTDP-4-dehydrorhamnose reductase n=1 Tax=Pseudopedobacter saltans (strain ATCC 51119 / DSM 12145 / JCM 21818 / CCUG 39354 / LMG 10337 / NBRC 100064 / NCIMB 13643) TaxID=762903 RepID=F0SDA5_PSESL|nr:SDR family oxidoreductase [Pseudopedobacter saltans]ADY52891.1 dTDP-4-dehydrorhamnose reductase [Pseudopedobacter saltans DSM 12145]
MKKILVTGSNGLLGQKLTDAVLKNKQFELIATGKGTNRHPVKEGYIYEEMDIIDKESIAFIVNKHQPDAIINTAAMTNVDTCETQREECWLLNVTAVEYLIDICRENSIQLIHLSTDFIFDGEDGPYTEEGQPNPLSYYGESKLAAEQLLEKSGIHYAILRTIIVYGIVNDMSRSNIILWAKGALEKGNPINVVNDQWRMPTLAEDLADICLLAVEKEAQGVYNASGKDLMSIIELVERVADYYGLDKSLIKPISSTTLNQAAKRPKRTGFILDKSIRELGYNPHSFEEGIRIMEKQLAVLQ